MENKDFAVMYLTDHRKALLEKRERLMRPLQELDQEIEHVTATLRSIQNTVQRIALPIKEDEFPIGKLRKLTQVQALVVIAKHNDGIIRAQEAKRLLIKAGVMRETKNSTNIIHAVILRSEKFERVRPGEYRLKEMKSSTGDGGVLHAPVQ
jgi:septal ring factor EnvC (AmiA/AmiB activator)